MSEVRSVEYLYSGMSKERAQKVQGLQLELPFMDPLTRVSYPRGLTIQERFELFHEANPQVYDTLVRTTRKLLIQFGIKKVSIKLPYELVRWTHYLRTSGQEKYKLSNDFTSRYSLLIQRQEPDLKGVFDTRDLRSK